MSHRRATVRGGRSTLLLAVLGAVVLVGAAVTFFVSDSGSQTVTGRGSPVGSSVPSLPPADHAGWTTLLNPAAGLSYQIPPANWRGQPADGIVDQVTLTEGATRTPYICGNPGHEYLRGGLGSGPGPRTDPGGLATSLAQTAAQQYYGTASAPPQLRVDPPQAVTAHTTRGQAVPGASVRVVSTQSSDPCLATRGEVLVLVLRLADRDAVLVLNGDLAGGPATPKPATENELREIVGTARPIG